VTRAELVRDLGKVSSTLVLAVGALERLSRSLGEPQEGPAREDAPKVGRPAIPVCACPLCIVERAEGKRP
jgi:hypothetical protein